MNRYANFVAALLLLSTPAFASNLDRRQQATAYSVLIKSNAKGASITRDGIIAGEVGNPVDGKASLNRFIVRKAGYIPRTIRLWLEKPEQVTVTVNLLETKTSKKAKNAPIVSAQNAPLVPKNENAPSICRAFKLSPAFQRTSCAREDWADDVFFAGFHWPDLGLYNKLDNADLALFQEFIADIGQKTTVDQQNKLESFLGKYPTELAAYQTAAMSYLFSKDCSPILEILNDAQHHGGDQSELMTIAGLCYESSGDAGRALPLFLTAIKSRTTPTAYYHLGRIYLGQKDSERAAFYLNECRVHHDAYYPCLELQTLLENPDGRGLFEARQQYATFLRNDVKALQKDLERSLDRGVYKESFLSIQQALNRYRHSYEVNWLEAFVNIKLGYDLSGDNLRQKALNSVIIDYNSAKRVLKRLDDLKLTKENHQAMAMALDPFTRQEPKETYFWWRQADTYSKGGECQEAMAVVDDSLKFLDEKSTIKLLQVKGGCLASMEKLDEAIDLYKKIVNLSSETWSSHYNLGVVLEKKGQKKAAMASFEKSLSLNPPSEVYNSILTTLQHYKKHKKKNSTSSSKN